MDLFLIKCVEDNSICLLSSAAVVFDPATVEKGSEVNFTYGGKRYQGIVVDFGDEGELISSLNEVLQLRSYRLYQVKRKCNVVHCTLTLPPRLTVFGFDAVTLKKSVRSECPTRSIMVLLKFLKRVGLPRRSEKSKYVPFI